MSITIIRRSPRMEFVFSMRSPKVFPFSFPFFSFHLQLSRNDAPTACTITKYKCTFHLCALRFALNAKCNYTASEKKKTLTHSGTMYEHRAACERMRCCGYRQLFLSTHHYLWNGALDNSAHRPSAHSTLTQEMKLLSNNHKYQFCGNCILHALAINLCSQDIRACRTGYCIAECEILMFSFFGRTELRQLPTRILICRLGPGA